MPALFEQHMLGCWSTALDVTDPHSIAEAVTKGIARFGRIDVLVNNAGVGLFGAAEATPAEVTQQVFETNTFGVMAVARAIIPHMRERGSGTIVNVTSSVGIAPMPLVAVYTASKYAIEGYSEALAHELGTFGVRVKIVQPGLAPTTSFAAKSGGRRDDPAPRRLRVLRGPLSRIDAELSNGLHDRDRCRRSDYAAATSSDDKLRYPAGADSVMLAQLRQSLSSRNSWAGCER